MKPTVLVCALIACASWTSISRSEQAPRTVEVEIVGGGEDAALLDATLRELMGRVQLRVIGVPSTSTDPLLSRVTIDLRSPDVARIVVVDARDGHVVMKRELARDPSASITRETIAHDVQTAVEAELLERESAPPPAPAPAPAPAPELAPTPVPEPAPAAAPRDAVAAAPSSSPFTVDVATFAAGGPIARSSGIAPRVGGGLLFSLGSFLRPSLAVTAAYAPPFESGTDVVASRASFIALRAMPAIELAHGSRLALDLGIGGGVDVLTVAPRSDVLPTSAVSAPTTHADAILSSMLTLRVGLVPSVVLLASAGADVDAFTRAYVVDRGGRQEDVFVPWRVRPTVALGFAFTAWGGP